MKRSEINQALKEMEAMIREYRISLPPFCHFTPDEWKTKGHEYDEIRDNGLGWDITDYGLGDFDKVGFSLITIRNGNVHDDKYPKPYAEKLLYIKEGQRSPMHFHWNKMEDIINRGGNDIEFTLYNADKETEQLADTDVEICQDGRRYTMPAGTKVILHPGESLTLYPYLYHEFVIPEGGPVLIGEVSMCNDDNTDNRFLNPLGRFPTIEEDEAPYRLLCNEYPPAKD